MTADPRIEAAAWQYAVHRWRLSPCQGRTLASLSRSQQFEARDAAAAALAAADAVAPRPKFRGGCACGISEAGDVLAVCAAHKAREEGARNAALDEALAAWTEAAHGLEPEEVEEGSYHAGWDDGVEVYRNAIRKLKDKP